MIFALSNIAILGSIVWSHHMFTVGMESDSHAYFMCITMIITIPTSTKIFNWLCTYLNYLYYYYIRTSVFLSIHIFLLMFTLGGTTGIIISNVIVDLSLHDTYYILSHFHYILSLGTVIVILLGLSYY